MTARKRSDQPRALSRAEILDELTKLAMAHMAWTVVNTKDNEDKVNALPKERHKELKSVIGLKPSRLTPQQLLEIRTRKAEEQRKKEAATSKPKPDRKSKNV